MLRHSSSLLLEQELQNNNKIDHVAQMYKLIAEIDKTTDKLDEKIQMVLKLKQNEFVNSYKSHMLRIKEELGLLHKQLQIKDKKILSYQSQGTFANLYKRIRNLEETEKRLLFDLSKKNSNIKELDVEKTINKSQNKRLQQKVKQLLRIKAKSSARISQIAFDYSSQQIFPTQVSQLSPEIEINLKNSSQIKGRRSLKTNVTVNPEMQFNTEAYKLQKELNFLEKENRKLVSLNNKLLTSYQESQKFFISIVSEMKKNISIRKQIPFCSLEDFRKEDKILLLIKVLSNDDILVCLYNKIFPKNNQLVREREDDLPKKKQLKPIFPQINSMKVI